jgi:hypothetical protein
MRCDWPLVRDLDLVLDVAEEAVCARQARREPGVDVAGAGEPLERSERPAHAEPRVLARRG